MNISAIVIDFGGVLVRTATRIPRIKWENKLGLIEGELDRIVFGSEVARKATIGLATSDDVWDSVKNELNLNQNEISELISDFWHEDFLDTSLIMLLKDLRLKYKTAILSNIWTGGRAFFKEKYGIKENATVNRIFVSCELGLAKPDQVIFYHVSKELDVKFDQMLFIDDFQENILAATTLGMNTHLFRDPCETVALLSGLL